jgi:hypothetical protein
MAENRVQTREPSFWHHSEYKSDGSIISGFIQNSATIAKFKDVVLTVTFKSQTGTVIEQKDYVFYEFYNPMSTKPFSLKVNQPEATKQFTVSIKNAAAAN